MWSNKKQLGFLVEVGLLLGELGDLHPVYLLHFKRHHLKEHHELEVVEGLAVAFEVKWSDRQRMFNRFMDSDRSFEGDVLALKSIWADAVKCNRPRHEEVLKRLQHSDETLRNLEILKSAWDAFSTTGTPNDEVLEVMAVYQRLLDGSTGQLDSGPQE